jgi:hypothetical protein
VEFALQTPGACVTAEDEDAVGATTGDIADPTATDAPAR